MFGDISGGVTTTGGSFNPFGKKHKAGGTNKIRENTAKHQIARFLFCSSKTKLAQKTTRFRFC
jgi:hypothetical protein